MPPKCRKAKASLSSQFFASQVVLMWYFGRQVRDQHKTTSNTYDISVTS